MFYWQFNEVFKNKNKILQIHKFYNKNQEIKMR